MDIKNNFLEEIKQLFLALRKISKDVIRLVSLETKLAKKSLWKIVELAFLLVIFIFFTWFGFMAMIATGLHDLGLNWVSSLFTVTLINVIGIVVLYVMILNYSKNLKFKATRSQLQRTKYE